MSALNHSYNMCNCLLSQLVESDHSGQCFPECLLLDDRLQPLVDSLLWEYTDKVFAIPFTVCVPDSSVEYAGNILSEVEVGFKTFWLELCIDNNVLRFDSFTELKQKLAFFDPHLMSLGPKYSSMSIPLTCLNDPEFMSRIDEERKAELEIEKLLEKLAVNLLNRNTIITSHQKVVDEKRKVKGLDNFIRRRHSFYKDVTPTRFVPLGGGSYPNKSFYSLPPVNGREPPDAKDVELIEDSARILQESLDINHIEKDDWSAIGRALDHVLEGYPLKKIDCWPPS